jgi:hypothetical protein
LVRNFPKNLFKASKGMTFQKHSILRKKKPILAQMWIQVSFAQNVKVWNMKKLANIRANVMKRHWFVGKIKF